MRFSTKYCTFTFFQFLLVLMTLFLINLQQKVHADVVVSFIVIEEDCDERGRDCTKGLVIRDQHRVLTSQETKKLINTNQEELEKKIDEIKNISKERKDAVDVTLEQLDESKARQVDLERHERHIQDLNTSISMLPIPSNQNIADTVNQIFEDRIEALRQELRKEILCELALSNPNLGIICPE